MWLRDGRRVCRRRWVGLRLSHRGYKRNGYNNSCCPDNADQLSNGHWLSPCRCSTSPTTPPSRSRFRTLGMLAGASSAVHAPRTAGKQRDCPRRWNSANKKSQKKWTASLGDARRPGTSVARHGREGLAPICRAVASKVGGSSCIGDGFARDVTPFGARSRVTETLRYYIGSRERRSAGGLSEFRDQRLP